MTLDVREALFPLPGSGHWVCPCGTEPPKRNGSATPYRTLVSLTEPACPFCGRTFREEWQVRKHQPSTPLRAAEGGGQ